MRLYTPSFYMRKHYARKELYANSIILPMKLKQEVSYKVEKSHKSVSCLQEIFNLLACLKKNDFSQEYCDIEIKGFQTCYDDHKNTLAKQKIENENIIALSGKTRYPTKQLNKLLRKYLV